MKKILLFCLLFTTVNAFSQTVPRLHFNYDSAGNQIKRYLNMQSTYEKNSDSTKAFKETADLKEDDLLKFSQEDFLSYYPNPVKEQLYLKWELQNEVQVSHLTIFTLAGQQLRTITNLEKVNNTTVPFSDLPSGTYLILLYYTSGKQESITILKP